MNSFTDYLHRRYDDAVEAAGDARARLEHQMHEGRSGLATAMAEVCHQEAYLGWWSAVVRDIDDHGLDPVVALTRTRTAARRDLLDRAIPLQASPFAHGESIASIEAARRFYYDTATIDVDAITRPAGSGPTAAIHAPDHHRI